MDKKQTMEQEIRKLDALLKEEFPELGVFARLAYVGRTIKLRGMEFSELAKLIKELFPKADPDDQLECVRQLLEPEFCSGLLQSIQ